MPSVAADHDPEGPTAPGSVTPGRTTLDTSRTAPRARFVGIGIDSYEHSGSAKQYDALPDAVANVDAIEATLNQFGFDPQARHNLTTGTYIDALEDAFEPPTGERLDALVVMWSGHGETTEESFLRFPLADSRPNSPAGLSARQLAGMALRTNARQILILIDTCFSGNTSEITTAVSKLRDAFGDTKSWVGLLASAHSWEKASGEGTLGPLVSRILTEGPSDPTLRGRFHALNAGIRGDDLIEAVKREWPTDVRHFPSSWETGLQEVMFPNPLHTPVAPDALDAQLIQIAEGRSGDEEGNFFSGRVGPLSQIVQWFESGTPGIAIVTGRAGTGKSAVVGRIVSLSDPETRATINSADIPAGTDPGAGAMHAHVQATGVSIEHLVEALDRQLSAARIFDPVSTPRNRHELLGALQRAATTQTIRIAIDGLDEVSDDAFALVTQLITPMATHAQVLMSSKDVHAGDRTLLATAAPALLIDLSTPAAQEETRHDVAAFIAQRLRDTTAGEDDIARVTNQVFASLSPGEGPFLVARLVTSQLRSSPIDFSSADWADHIAFTIEDLFLAALDGITESSPSGVEGRVAARDLLTALAFAFGEGVPDTEWTLIANAITGRSYTREDGWWIAEHMSEFIISSSVRGRAVHRLAYDRVTAKLAADLGRMEGANPEDGIPPRISRALAEQYDKLLTVAAGPLDGDYLSAHYWRYAALAGPAGMESLGALRADHGDAHLDLTRQEAMGWSALSSHQADIGLAAAAAESSLVATQLLLEAADDDPRLGPELAMVMETHAQNLLSSGQVQAAEAPARISVDMLRAFADVDPKHRPQLALSLRVQAMVLTDLGELGDGPEHALELAQESLALFIELRATDTAFAPDVATGHHQVGVIHASLGNHRQALASTEDSLRHWQQLVAREPRHQRYLGRAYDALGTRLAVIGAAEGRPEAFEAALAAGLRAVEIFRTCLTDAAPDLADLGQGLTNLAIRHADARDWAAAVDAGAEAIEINRHLAADNPYYLLALARSLVNQGNRMSEGPQPENAISLHEEAVDTFEDARMEGRRPDDYANALHCLSVSHLRADQWHPALIAAERAVATSRQMARDNPQHRSVLAQALNNLSNCHDEVGDDIAALAAARDAVAIRREEIAVNPAVAEALGQSLNNLSLRLATGGAHEESMAIAQETLVLFQSLDRVSEARRFELTAMAHRNLGNRFHDADDLASTISHFTQASSNYKRIVDDGLPFANELAQTQFQLGGFLAERGDFAAAAQAAQNAVNLFAPLAGDLASMQNLAVSLRSLSRHRRDAGQLADATAAAIDAIDVMTDLAGANPPFTADLAATIHELVDGDPTLTAEEKEHRWSTAAAKLGDRGRLVPAFRAPWAPDPETAVMGIATAWSDDPADRAALVWQSRVARKVHGAAQFDAAWAEHDGAVPDWLRVDPDSVALVEDWFRTRSLRAAQAFAIENRDALLQLETQEALDQLAREHPGMAGKFAARAELIDRARTDGFAAAYEPHLAGEAVHRLMTSTPADQIVVLRGEQDLILSDAGVEVMNAWHPDTPGTTDIGYTKGLLTLASVGFLDPVTESLASVEARRAVVEVMVQKKPLLLEAFAEFQRGHAHTDAMSATAMATWAIAMALQGNSETALSAAEQTRYLDQPTAAWATVLIAEHAANHAELLPLMKPLVRPDIDLTESTESTPAQGAPNA